MNIQFKNRNLFELIQKIEDQNTIQKNEINL